MVFYETLYPAAIDSAEARGLEIVRATELLYTIGERNLARTFVIPLGSQNDDIAILSTIAEIAMDHEDPQSTLLIGKAALARGLPVVPYAFPTRALPRYKPMGAAIDPSMVYAVMRTESEFDPRDVSPAKPQRR